MRTALMRGFSALDLAVPLLLLALSAVACFAGTSGTGAPASSTAAGTTAGACCERSLKTLVGGSIAMLFILRRSRKGLAGVGVFEVGLGDPEVDPPGAGSVANVMPAEGLVGLAYVWASGCCVCRMAAST